MLDVEELLNTTTIDVVVYNGQLDLIVDTPGQIVWTEKLYWTDRAGWYAANRQSLTVNGFTEGYLKEYNHFRWFWIDRAGHMVRLHASLRVWMQHVLGKKIVVKLDYLRCIAMGGGVMILIC
ncbi:hypothetical protein B566_EDAN008539 [Ephemera danica]|nr:hypothetical protein B566_EDAN008539 [Ephemera danica]